MDTPTREENLKRIKEMQEETPKTWQEAVTLLIESNEMLLRAIEWAFS